MHKQRLAGIIAGIISLAGTLLPWVSNVPVVNNVSGTSWLIGWVVLLSSCLSIFFYLSGDDKAEAKKTAVFIGLISGVLTIAISLYKLVNIQSEINLMKEKFSVCQGWANDISFGFGLYLVIAGGILQILVAILMRPKKAVESKA